jgi:hypothetical protein
MAVPNNQPTRFDRELRGPEITVDGHTIQPVARMTGQHASGGNGSSVWGYATVRVAPTDVIVCRGDGAAQRVQVTDPTRAAIQSMAMTAGAIAAVCLVIMLIVRIVRGLK